MRHKSGEIDRIIGANIANRRAMSGMSQVALGQALPDPVTYQQISKFEKGTNRVTAGRLLDFANVFGCAVTDLYEGVANQLPPEVVNIGQAKLVRNYRALTPNMQSAVSELVFAISKDVAQGFKKEMPRE